MSHSRNSYNPDNCSDIIGSLYEPALAESVRYDRTTYGFSPAGLINAAAGIAGLVRNGGRIQLICDQTLEANLVQAVIDGKLQAADALRNQHTTGVPDRHQSLMISRAERQLELDHLDGQKRPAGNQGRHQGLGHLPPEDRHTD